MGWIIWTGILLALFVVAVVCWFAGKTMNKQYEAGVADGTISSRDTPPPLKVIGISSAIVIAVLWVASSAFLMFHTVGQREVAVVYNFSNVITGKRDPGVVTVMPWEHIKKENVGILHDEWNFGEGNSAASIDQQPVFANLAVNYQIDPARVVDLYERVGPNWKSIIIDARVPQVFKETTATFTTPEVIQKRAELRQRTKERLIEELDLYDINVIDVFVTNLGFSKGYQASIEAKQKQVQDSQRAQAKVAEIEAVARQKIAEAEGAAKANVARARGEATANRLRQRSLTKLLIQQQAIEKLNPNVQVIICPPQSVCIPNSGIVPNPGGTP